MTGSLQKKNNRYFIVLNFKGSDGKNKTKWFKTGLTVHGNKRRAEEMLREKLKEYKDNENFSESSQILFADYAESWLVRKKDQVQLSTWESYSMYVTKHIVPYFRQLNLTLDQVRPIHISNY